LQQFNIKLIPEDVKMNEDYVKKRENEYNMLMTAMQQYKELEKDINLEL
jgi:hypothetical protein